MFLYLANNVKQCSISKQGEKRVFELGIKKLLLYNFYILDTLSLPLELSEPIVERF